MKVHTITDPKTIKGLNINHRKEKHFQEQYSLVAVYKGDLKQVAQLRTYGTSSMNYCCLWVNDSKTQTYQSGSGSAGGYGYHRPSAAAMEAFNNAGIYLDSDIAGRGDRAIEDALIALGKKLGYRKLSIIKAHG